MERTKYLFLVFFSFCTIILLGQNNESIYQAYKTGNMVQWKRTMDALDNKNPRTNKDKLDIINFQYGYIAWCIGKKNKKEAEAYMSKAEKQIELLEKNKYNLSMLYAYKAAFIGFEIGISMYKAPFIGSQSLEFANKSVALDAQNALAYAQLGNIAFYTPKVLGGSKPDAMKHYLKALKLMELHPNENIHNWNYLNLLATIINAYMEIDQYTLAKKYCLKTLAIEPEFNWVKNELYPKILKKL